MIYTNRSSPQGPLKRPVLKSPKRPRSLKIRNAILILPFVNELAKIFSRMDIDTQAVLEAAGTKWNFLPFKPGLVGGHCIGVDPYYLAQKAQEVGYHPKLF